MIIERNENEVVFRLSGDIDIDGLQDMADVLEFREISKKSRATQKDVDKLAKKVKKGRWEKARKEIGL